jgi:4-amino-4-deoxychorismate lyase
MCLFTEAVRIQDGLPRNLEYHQKRCGRTRQRFFPELPPLDLERALSGVTLPREGRHKCRILYSAGIEEIDVTPYTPRRVESLKIVEDDTIDYRYKYADRSAVEKLLARREGCDDVLIVRQGKVTDISYANVAFLLRGRWYTPSSVLLPGTMRRFLLDTRRIEEREIVPEDIRLFEGLSLINAMLDLGEVVLDCSRIRY